MSFWRELGRRSVFRTGAAYAVIAWLLVQIADVILPAFGAPAWVFQGFLVLVATGFLITLVLAWLYEVTPQGVKRANDVQDVSGLALSHGRKLDFAIIALLGVAIVFLIARDYLAPGAEQSTVIEGRSLAVLAFTNRSADPDDAFFADGLADELLSLLSRVPELRVAPRTSSFYFKGKNMDIDSIASMLDVENVLSGSFQRDGDRIRVTVALDSALEGGLLWSERYDRNADNLLELQSEIAQSVTSAIMPVISPASQSLIAVLPTENSEAYDFYLRAREYLRLPSEETTVRSAEELFNRAISLDPRFASAHAGLCETLLARYRLFRSLEFFEAAETACHRALTLDSGSWEVRLALADLYGMTGQFDKAVLELEAGISRQPNTVDLILALGTTYSAQGNFDLAEETLLRAESLDSSYYRVHNSLGHLYWDTSRYELAAERYRKVIELTPDSGIGYDNLGNTYLSMGNFAEAEEVLNSSPLPSRWTYENRGIVYYLLGDFRKAVEDHLRALDLAPENYTEWGNLGDAYRFIPGNEENAREAYERAIEFAEQELTLNPDDLEAAARLSTYHAFTGNTDEAERLIQRVSEEAEPPGYPSEVAYFFAARAKMQMQEADQAFDLLLMALQGFPAATILNDPDLRTQGGLEFDAFAEEHVRPLLNR